MIDLPKTMKIGGHEYKILFPYVFKERFDRWGQCDDAHKEIRLGFLDQGGRERKASSVMVTFIHEMLHAIDRVTGYEVFVDNEKAIEGFSESIYQVLVDNKWMPQKKAVVAVGQSVQEALNSPGVGNQESAIHRPLTTDDQLRTTDKKDKLWQSS